MKQICNLNYLIIISVIKYRFKFIIIQSFLISNEFEPIGDNIYAKVATDASKIIHSLVSENKKNF